MYIVYVFNIHVYMQIYYVFIWFSMVSSPSLSLCNMDLWLKFVWRNQELHRLLHHFLHLAPKAVEWYRLMIIDISLWGCSIGGIELYEMIIYIYSIDSYCDGGFEFGVWVAVASSSHIGSGSIATDLGGVRVLQVSSRWKREMWLLKSTKTQIARLLQCCRFNSSSYIIPALSARKLWCNKCKSATTGDGE